MYRNYFNNRIHPAQTELQYYGILQVSVVCEQGSRPVENALVKILSKEVPTTVLAELSTDVSGMTEDVALPAPPIEYSLTPTDIIPYSEYIIIVTAPGLQTVIINSAQILPNVKSTQPVSLPRKSNQNEEKVIIIPPHALLGYYPPNLYQDEIKEYIETDPPKPIVIPDLISVHNGIPEDINAAEYIVEYKEYIKSVVSSNIYATWPEETIYAYTLSVLSFTLNRYYTNWYPMQGYNFTITSTYTFDNLWIYGRNIYNNISLAVDYLFHYFLSRPNINQPILTQTCRGTLVICPPLMMSLWGSKSLGDRGYDADSILKFYYGDTIYINSSSEIDGILMKWPGFVLSEGSTGDSVKQIQNQLMVLSNAYTAIPRVTDDGIYGSTTTAAVTVFQELFDLPVTGLIDGPTWNKISKMYSKIMNSNNLCR